jgi:hypothetical protein
VRDVTLATVPAPLHLPSAADCVRFERDSFGALQQTLRGLSAAEREEAWIEIEEALGRFETAEVFEGPCELIVASGAW